MSTDAPDTPAPEAGSEIVVVGTGEQAPRSRTYHTPADGRPLQASCGRTRLDGQRLPRSLAEQQRLDPCPDCFEDA